VAGFFPAKKLHDALLSTGVLQMPEIVYESTLRAAAKNLRLAGVVPGVNWHRFNVYYIQNEEGERKQNCFGLQVEARGQLLSLSSPDESGQPACMFEL
jgi:hypothetical protein